MAARKASEVFVECLEAEGVRYVFGIPGEETLDLNESLANSSIQFVPVRHEQGGAYMADATVASPAAPEYAWARSAQARRTSSRRWPTRSSIALRWLLSTGQSDLERMHKESHQYIDSDRHPAAGGQVERPRVEPGDHPRGRAQGVQGSGVREAGVDPPRAARGRDGAPARRLAAAAPRACPARAGRQGAASAPPS